MPDFDGIPPGYTFYDEAMAYIEKQKALFKINCADEYKKHNYIKVSDKFVAYAITKSTNKENTYQLTTFNISTNEPLGHSEHPSLYEAIDYLTSNVSQKRFHRPDLPDTAALDVFPDKAEYTYEYKYRPMSLGTQPAGFIRGEEGGEFGRVVYLRPLTSEEMNKFELIPAAFKDITNIEKGKDKIANPLSR